MNYPRVNYHMDEIFQGWKFLEVNYPGVKNTVVIFPRDALSSIRCTPMAFLQRVTKLISFKRTCFTFPSDLLEKDPKLFFFLFIRWVRLCIHEIFTVDAGFTQSLTGKTVDKTQKMKKKNRKINTIFLQLRGNKLLFHKKLSQ